MFTEYNNQKSVRCWEECCSQSARQIKKSEIESQYSSLKNKPIVSKGNLWNKFMSSLRSK